MAKRERLHMQIDHMLHAKLRKEARTSRRTMTAQLEVILEKALAHVELEDHPEKPKVVRPIYVPPARPVDDDDDDDVMAE